MDVSVPEITREMIAAGLEAKRDAKRDCLTEAEEVQEIFLAMYGQGTFMETETVH